MYRVIKLSDGTNLRELVAGPTFEAQKAKDISEHAKDTLPTLPLSQHIVDELRAAETLLDKNAPKWGMSYEATLCGIAASQLEAVLIAQQERENPQPLTYEELSVMLHKHVWVKTREGFVIPAILGIDASTCQYVAYCGERGIIWINEITKTTVYAHEPKGEHHE